MEFSVKKVGDQKQLYVEFYVAFSPEMYATFASGGLGSSKLFRIYSFTGGWDQPFNYFNGTSHPEIVWNVYGSPKKYRLRNQVTTLGMHNDSSTILICQMEQGRLVALILLVTYHI